MRTFIAGAAAAAAVTAGVIAVPSGAEAAPIPSCKGALIAVSHNQQQGATGHGNVVLRFRNISQHTCSLRGYPGVDALGPRGGVLAHARRTLHGFTGGASAVRTIVLRSWQVASADLEWMNFGPNGTSCRISHSIAVTPANTFRTVHFPLSVSVCDLQIHPTVKGPTGNGA
jgi:hypothetical protein